MHVIFPKFKTIFLFLIFGKNTTQLIDYCSCQKRTIRNKKTSCFFFKKFKLLRLFIKCEIILITSPVLLFHTVLGKSNFHHFARKRVQQNKDFSKSVFRRKSNLPIGFPKFLLPV